MSCVEAFGWTGAKPLSENLHLTSESLSRIRCSSVAVGLMMLDALNLLVQDGYLECQAQAKVWESASRRQIPMPSMASMAMAKNKMYEARQSKGQRAS